MKKTNKRGFTIVELVIVIAVIAILATVLVPTFSGVIEQATNAALDADAKAIYTQYVSADNGANAGKDFVIKAAKGSKTQYYYVVDGAFDADNCLETEPTATELVTEFGTGAAYDDTADTNGFADNIYLVKVA